MATINFIVLTICIVGLVKSDGKTFQDSKYDLGNGPVLYEAYYPDNEEQDISQNTQKIIHNENPVIEKSYQQKYSENDYQNLKPEIIDNNSNQLNYHHQTDNNNNNNNNNYPVINQPFSSYITNQQPILNNQNNIENALNILINAIREKKIETHPIYKNYEQTLNFQPNQRKIIESGKFVFPNENFGYENHRPVDNIYQARPQVISYIFSPTREPQNVESFKPAQSFFQDKNEKQRVSLFRENLTKMAGIDVIKPRVASIQVSQESHKHKHRHHHGEKTRSNYHDSSSSSRSTSV